MTIRDTIDFYKKHFSECWDEEKYKWIAAKHFRDNWDIDAESFADMLVDTSLSNDFCVSRYVFC